MQSSSHLWNLLLASEAHQNMFSGHQSSEDSLRLPRKLSLMLILFIYLILMILSIATLTIPKLITLLEADWRFTGNRRTVPSLSCMEDSSLPRLLLLSLAGKLVRERVLESDWFWSTSDRC